MIKHLHSGAPLVGVASLAGLLLACSPDPRTESPPDLASPSERHLSNIRQLTFGGQNAEAYFSADDKSLIFQSTRDGHHCDQIFTMKIDGSDVRRVSTGQGATTCSFLFPGGDRILYSSTHLGGPECPPRPDFSRGYVWALYPTYDIFTADIDGSNLQQLTDTWGYDAEATIATDGSVIVFTSVRDGDIDIYTMDADGSNVRRLTHELGYDGGAFFSPDGSRIVYRASRHQTEEEKQDYLSLLEQNLIRPGSLDIYVMDSDGSNKRQLTDNGAANFAPYFFPSGERVIFASNVHDPDGRNFDLYAIDIDGSNLERITFDPDFDSFPMFSSDGNKLVWASNRNGQEPGETNVFIADWVD